jgi:exodeoxyribonuclease VII small subunit
LKPLSQARRTARPGAEATRFEAALAELEQVVEQLELGRLGLDEAVRLFERGSQLVATCQGILDQSELRVTRLAAETATPLADAPTAPA